MGEGEVECVGYEALRVSRRSRRWFRNVVEGGGLMVMSHPQGADNKVLVAITILHPNSHSKGQGVQ